MTQNWKNGLIVAFNRNCTFAFSANWPWVCGLFGLLALGLTPLNLLTSLIVNHWRSPLTVCLWHKCFFDVGLGFLIRSHRLLDVILTLLASHFHSSQLTAMLISTNSRVDDVSVPYKSCKCNFQQLLNSVEVGCNPCFYMSMAATRLLHNGGISSSLSHY